MTLLPVCGWTLLRSAVVSVVVVWLARALSRSLAAGPGAFRSGVMLALTALCAMPDLAAGYAWADTGLSLALYPVLNEVLYALLLAGRLLPLATVLVLAAPADPMTPAAWHCLKLMGTTWWERCGVRLWNLLPSAGPIAGLIFLLAFQDFELASRMAVKTWTVRLFDLHAREGLPLSDSVGLTLIPVLVELILIGPVLLAMRLLERRSAPVLTVPDRPPRTAALGLVLLAFLVLVCGVPGWIMFRGLLAGGSVLVRDAVYREQLPREIAAGMFVAALSASLAFTLGSMLAERIRRQRVWGVLIVPGLLGGLVLSLIGRYAGQEIDAFLESVTGRPGVYHTPVPLVLIQTLVLLPRAALMWMVLPAFTQFPAAHLATLLDRAPDERTRTAAELRWTWQTRPRFWAVVLLAWWAYWDLTTFAILSPTGFVSAPVRLYNFMHYRQNTILSAMLAVSILAPLCLAGLLSAVIPWRAPFWWMATRGRFRGSLSRQ